MADNSNKKEENNKKNNKNSFIKEMLKSVKNFEKYEDFAVEGFNKTFKYMFKLVAIFTLIITIISIYKFSEIFKLTLNEFDKNIESLKYNEGNLEINNNEKVELENKDLFVGKILIDTSNLDEEKIKIYKENMKKDNNKILILKDKILINNENINTEILYKDLLEKYNIKTINKVQILDYFNNNKLNILLTIIPMMYIYMFIIYLVSIMLDALLLGLLAYITARISSIKMSFSSSYSVGVHSLTLPIILNIIVILLNIFFGFTVKYFQVMYTAISYIYVITAVLMIKSDLIKRQGELNKLNSMQEEIRIELANKKQKEEDQKQEEKNKEEKEKQKEKESKNKKENDEVNSDIGDKPQGSNV